MLQIKKTDTAAHQTTTVMLAHMRAELDETSVTAMIAHPRFADAKRLVADRQRLTHKTIGIRFDCMRDLINGKLNSSSNVVRCTGQYIAGAITGSHLTAKETAGCLDTLTKSIAFAPKS